jgi:hypothetical protein
MSKKDRHFEEHPGPGAAAYNEARRLRQQMADKQQAATETERKAVSAALHRLNYDTARKN